MSDLGDLLELLHGPPDRWATVRLAVRRWTDSEATGRAMERAAERSRAAGATVVSSRRSHGDDSPVWESLVRAWVDKPGRRSRAEADGPHGASLHVTRGELWWSYTELSGAITNEDEPDVRGGGGLHEVDWMLDPSYLLGGYQFSVTGPREVAGRPAVGARAVRRPETAPGRLLVAEPAFGADELALAVDRATGVVLRGEARSSGEVLALWEAVEAAFDVPLDDGLFRFEAPDGSVARSPGGVFARPRPLSVEEAARRASFTVVIPALVPRGWTMAVLYVPAADRPPRGDTVMVHLGEDGRAPRVRLHETAEPIADNLAWEAVEHRGRAIEVVETPGGLSSSLVEARAEVAGTHVRASGEVERRALLDIVASLAPAPRDLPPFD
jgi:outer membrane lipoprotein-sorting protein